jgi:transcription initiation factor TFIID subunit 10
MNALPEGTSDLLERLDEQPPLVPDELTQYILCKSGQGSSDLRVTRIVSLAGQRFISAVLNETLQLCKTRLTASKRQLKQGGYVEKRELMTEDLAKALKEYGVHLSRPQYYLDDDSKVEGAPK